jgi:hypothetical protein
MCSPRKALIRERCRAARPALSATRRKPQTRAPTTVGTSPTVNDTRVVRAVKARIPIRPPVTTCNTAYPGRMPR